LPDFDSLSAGGIAAGAGGNAGGGGTAGSAGSGGSSAGSGGSAGTGGSTGTAGNPGVLPDGGLANLIQNPDFEESANRWTQIGNCLLRIVTTPPAQSGSRSLEVSNRTVEWEGPGYSLVNLLTDGATYDAGVWVKVAEGEIPLQLTYKRRCDGDPDLGAYTPVGGPIIATTEWQHIAGALSTPTCDPIESVLFIEVPNGSRTDPNAFVTFYIDNASLVVSE
jgi:hypothetical protein